MCRVTRKSTPAAALSLVKGLLDANPAMRQWDTLPPAAAQARFGTTDIVRCMFGLMMNGVTEFRGRHQGRIAPTSSSGTKFFEGGGR